MRLVPVLGQHIETAVEFHEPNLDLPGESSPPAGCRQIKKLLVELIIHDVFLGSNSSRGGKLVDLVCSFRYFPFFRLILYNLFHSARNPNPRILAQVLL